VGHEIDISLTDLVADLRAATPSAAAELAVADRRDVVRSLDDLSVRLASGLTGRTRVAAERLARTGDRLEASMSEILTRMRHAVERPAAQLEALSPLRVLGRGYAVAMDLDGRVLKRLADFPEDRVFQLHVSDGRVRARVE
jgi:exodeoxyribonuclease VII large subunit